MIQDHEGNSFPTKTAMYKHWRTTSSRVNWNLKKGATLEQALTAPKISASEAGKRGRRASGWRKEGKFCTGRRVKHQSYGDF